MSSEGAGVDETALRAGKAARIRVRMRRRLIGAAALLLGTAVVVPMMLDPAPRPLPDNIPVDIPSERTPFAPRLSLPPSASGAPSSAPSSAPGAPGATGGKPGAPAGEPAAAPGATEGKPSASQSEPAPATGGASESASADARSAKEQPQAAPAAGAGEGSPDEARSAKSGRWFVQAAALSSESAARQLSERLTKVGLAPFVERTDAAGSTLYRVRLGPYASRDAAVKVRRHLHAMGVGSNVVRVEEAQR
jgi:DedD protein